MVTMARTFQQPGDTIDADASVGGTDGVRTGEVVVLGSLVGIAETTALPGESFALNLVGVHRLPKGAEQINAGAKVHWSGAAVTATAGANRLLGAAVERELPATPTSRCAERGHGMRRWPSQLRTSRPRR